MREYSTDSANEPVLIYNIHYIYKEPVHYPSRLSVHQWPGRTGFNPMSYQRLINWYFIPLCLTLTVIKVRINGKMLQSKERNGDLPYASVW